MKKIIYLSFVVLVLFSSGYTYAGGGYLVQNSVITKIEPIWGTPGDDGFIVSVTGGSGKCVGQRIIFPLSAALVEVNSSAGHRRLYAAALVSLTARLKVDIYNNIDGTSTVAEGACTHANFIYLKK